MDKVGVGLRFGLGWFGGLLWAFLFNSRPTSSSFFLFFLEYMVKYT